MSGEQKKKGLCYLVGAGPGDIGLLTLKGKDCIERADVLIYDALSSPKLLRWVKADCELIDAGKRADQHTLSQNEINALCVKKTLEGKIVTRLKGGDPFLFGRGGEEAEELEQAGVNFETVPGISSGVAGPAYAGIPVTHRAHCSQVTLLTGHEDPTKEESSIDYAHLANTPGTKVIYMGMKRLGLIVQQLLKFGAEASTPVAIIQWATTNQQRSLRGTLETIVSLAQDKGFSAPAIIVIGDVVKEREELNWFEKRPLFGKTVVVTRTQAQASQLSEKLNELGANVIEIPTIAIAPPQDSSPLLQATQDAHTYDWLIFTSPNGVEKFFETYYAQFDDARSLGLVRIAAIGPATAAKIRHYRFKPDVMPSTRHVAEGLIEEFRRRTIENQTMLWIKAESTRSVIEDELSQQGAIVDTVIAYRTVSESQDVLAPLLKTYQETNIDYVTFTSASTVEHFYTLLAQNQLAWPEGAQAVSIGPVTTQSLENRGKKQILSAKQHTIVGLIDAILGECS